MRYDNVIWDWNGTLLDDVSVCIQSMNELLNEYGLSALSSPEHYRSVFGFPVRDYYARLGFDFAKTPFEITGMEFIEKYDRIEHTAPLADGAVQVLERFRAAGLKQIVLSASELNALRSQISDRGIAEFFDDILGIDNRLAAGKADIAKRFFEQKSLDPKRTVFIGDTEHDYAVAKQLGCDCILTDRGHMSRESLLALTDRVVSSLLEAADMALDKC